MNKIFITLFSIFSSPYFLQAITLEQVQERYLEMQSFQGTFQQTTIIESEARRASASGMIAYQRPGKMRWEYQEPDPQLLVTDGNTLWLYDHLLENVTIQELAVVTDGTALAFLLGAGELTDEFTQRRMQKSLLDPDKSWKVLELVPNREKSAIEFLQLGVDSESGDLEALLFKDNSGSVRIIEFEALSYNVEFSEGFFSFEIPPGMEVIRP
jgi:outer membrane lipoprotein carrier protein